MTDPTFPILIVAARPMQAISNLPRFFESAGPYFQLLRDTKPLRRSGWNLRTTTEPIIVNGNAWRATNGGQKDIILREDLMLLTIASLGPEFLGWGSDIGAANPRINSIAIVEYAYEFARVFGEILKIYNTADSFALYVSIQFPKANVGGVELGTDKVGRGSFALRGKILDENFEKILECAAAKYDAAEIGYQILEVIFRHFGFPADAEIPYTDLAGKKIDQDSILHSRG